MVPTAGTTVGATDGTTVGTTIGATDGAAVSSIRFANFDLKYLGTSFFALKLIHSNGVSVNQDTIMH